MSLPTSDERGRKFFLNCDLVHMRRFDILDELQGRWGLTSRRETVCKLIDEAERLLLQEEPSGNINANAGGQIKSWARLR